MLQVLDLRDSERANEPVLQIEGRPAIGVAVVYNLRKKFQRRPNRCSQGLPKGVQVLLEQR